MNFLLRCKEESGIFNKFILSYDHRFTMPIHIRHAYELYDSYDTEFCKLACVILKGIIIEITEYKPKIVGESNQSFIKHINEAPQSVQHLINIFTYFASKIDDETYACKNIIDGIINDIFEHARHTDSVQSLIELIDEI